MFSEKRKGVSFQQTEQAGKEARPTVQVKDLTELKVKELWREV